MTAITVTTARNYDDALPTALAGTISSSTSSTTLTGVGTAFNTTNTPVGTPIYSGTTFIGVVASVTNTTTIVLTENAAATVTNAADGFAYLGLSLLNGETITINGGSVTIDADVRWNQQAAVFGDVTLSTSLGGSFLIDGTKVWEVPFSASTGNVPAQAALGSNGVTGTTSGATGELLRVWATGSLDPAAAGGAMPATGWIKLRSKTGNFQSGETITLPGGASITASSAGKRSWINVVGAEDRYLTVPRLGTFSVNGDWYELGLTDGTDNQTFQFPVLDECPGVQVETAPGSNLYEWWSHAAMRWNNNVASEPPAAQFAGVSSTYNNILGPQGALPGGQHSLGVRLRETATSSTHGLSSVVNGNTVATGALICRTWIKKETRRYVLVQAHSGSARYGALVDLDAGTIIANPAVGSPTGTSSNIQSVGGGWYQVQVNLNHTQANACSINIYSADSATPTYNASGHPTYLGSTAEGFYFSEAQIVHSTLQQVPTDERGRFYFSDATTGLLQFAKRDANYNAGFKPPSGCRVRIPNVIVSSSVAGDWSRNTLNAQGVSRTMRLNTSNAGAVTIRNAIFNTPVFPSSPSMVVLENSAFALQIAITNAANPFTITNCCVSQSRSVPPPSQANLQAATISNCISGGAVVGSTFVHGFNAGAVAAVSSCVDIGFTDCSFFAFANNFINIRGNNTAVNLVTCTNTTFDDCATIGAGLFLQTANNTTISNLRYAHYMINEAAQAFGQYAVVVTASDTVTLDGFASFANIPGVHPYAGIISTSNLSNNIELRNVGTPAAPYNAGTANQMAVLAALVGVSTNVTLRRVYGQNLRTSAISTVEANENVNLFNVWGDAGDSQVIIARNALAQGCRWTNTSSAQSAVYGTHWQDAFVSSTDGRLMIAANEPTTQSAAQCTGTFTTGSGFNAAGSVLLKTLSDTVTWTMPYMALGHVSVARFTSGTFTNPWDVAGNNTQFLEFDYQIDTGSGWSAWKHLLNQGRRAAGGGSGTNTVTLVTAERTAMLRQPQIGDFVQTGSNRLPHGTTIINVTGDVLTLSNNFASSATVNESILIWRDISGETISSSTGYKLKVRVKVNTANSSNSMLFLRIPFDTTSVDQQIQYPLPTTLNVAQINNLVAGSRVQVYNVTTATEVANEIVSGTAWSLEYNEGTNFSQNDVIRVRVANQSGTSAYLPFSTLALAGATGWTVLASQQADTVYNAIGVDGSTITEFTPDYPNVQVDISDPDGSTRVDRLYAWFVHTQSSEDGIRNWFGGIVPEDEANFRVVTSTLDLKIDNVAATGVTFTDGRRLYRDDNASPLVGSTSGGGSITLFAGKVYTSVVSTSSPVITGDISQVPAAVQTGLTSQGYTTTRAAKLDNADVATSTRLASASYTAPPTVSAIRTEIDTNSTKLDVSVGTRLASASYISPPSVSDIRSEIDSNSTKLDVAVGTRLASSSYVAPDNAGIAANGLAIANLNDFDPTVDTVIVGTNNDKSGYTISGTITTLDALDTQQDAQHAQTQSDISSLNNISAAEVNSQVDLALIEYDSPTKSELDAAFEQIKGAGWTNETLKNIRDNTDLVNNSAIASAVRTELTVELNRIDDTISSRLSSSSYVIPPTVTAIRQEIDANSVKLDVAVSTRNSVQPDNAGIVAIKAKTDNIPMNPVDVSDLSTLATQASVDALGTPLQATNYIAPDNAGITSIALAIASLNDFDPASDSVIVGTNNDKSGYLINGTITTLDDLNIQQNIQHSDTRSDIDQKLTIVNNGVKKSSLLIPHTDNL